jgi:hypothetical protein
VNVEFRRRPTFDAIFEDDDFKTLAAVFLAERLVRGFVVMVVSEWTEAPNIGFATAGRIWGAPHVNGDPSTIDGVADAGRLLDRLYANHGFPNAGNLRGALLEGLVLESLRPRYGATNLSDNVEITITNNANYTSPANRPIDVVGWDGNVGECHDCKMKPISLDAAFIKHLADGLPRPEFRLGVVTSMSEVTARASLRRQGYSPPAHVALIAVEQIIEFVPLQSAA